MSELKQNTTDRTEELRALLRERILVIDGAMGTTIREYNLTEEDIRGERFKDAKKDLKNNGDPATPAQREKEIEAAKIALASGTFSGVSVGT